MRVPLFCIGYVNVLIRPSILPGELDHGYIGRLSRFNGVGDVDELKIWLADWAGMSELPPYRWSFSQILSRFTNVEVTQFVRQYTTIPLFYSIRLLDERTEATDQSSLEIPNCSLSYTANYCYLCDKCIEQDLLQHGQSYWRRDHQIPGLLWCLEHKSLLCWVYGLQWFNKPPSEAVSAAQKIAPDWLQEGLDNPYIGRYIELACSLTEHPRAFDTNAVMHMLSNELVLCGFLISANSFGFRKILDDLKLRFGEVWVNSVMPFCIKSNGKYSSKRPPYVGSVEIHPPYSDAAIKCLTVCALVYESAQLALNALSKQ